ncbi:MAG TPA: AmmeMemoRadiSam system protein B, partial [Armatimonadetes bacterium]|nr:AmmeMemoRadiSam system protein B [Armatimonadota bacterium]
RPPAVAGRFYEGTSETLRHQIEVCFLHDLGPGKLPPQAPVHDDMPILGLVCPHAGYMFSGPTAARAYYQLALQPPPDAIIIIGPDHHSWAPDAGVYPEGSWLTPLGEVSVAEDIAQRIVNACPYAEANARAHTAEHSLEVQIPFIQFCYPSPPPIVPIIMGRQVPEVARALGDAIADAVQDIRAVLIASTDFTHYESHSQAQKKDAKVLERIEALDADGVFDAVARYHVSMCGYGATATLLHACRKLGSTVAKVLGYSTSGDIIRDYSQVVGYGAVAVLRANFTASDLEQMD